MLKSACGGFISGNAANQRWSQQNQWLSSHQQDWKIPKLNNPINLDVPNSSDSDTSYVEEMLLQVETRTSLCSLYYYFQDIHLSQTAPSCPCPSPCSPCAPCSPWASPCSPCVPWSSWACSSCSPCSSPWSPCSLAPWSSPCATS